MTKTVIISTVGTSLFTNYMKFRSDNEELNLKSIKDEFDFLEKDNADKFKNNKQCEEKANRIKERLVPNAFDSLKEKASAEIASITKFVSERNLDKGDVILYFIISDTAHSLLAAQIITEHLKEQGFSIDNEKQLKVIRALSVLTGEDFEKKGLPNMAKTICDIKNDKELSKEKPQFFINITGGYKGVLPYIYLIAQMYEIPAFYIYENSEDLIYLPQMPLAFDPILAEEYYYWLNNAHFKGDVEPEIMEELKEYGFIKVGSDGTIERSGMGDVFCDWVSAQAPESPLTVGKFIEYKLLEAFYDVQQKKQEFHGKIIADIKHSEQSLLYMHWENPDPEKKPRGKGREIDILLIYSDGSKEFIEIKSSRDFLKSTKVMEQFQGRVERVKSKNLDNITLSFLLYSMLPKKSVASQIANRMESFKEEAGDIPVKFRYIKIDRQSRIDAYSKFLDSKLTLNEINDL